MRLAGRQPQQYQPSILLLSATNKSQETKVIKQTSELIDVAMKRQAPRRNIQLKHGCLPVAIVLRTLKPSILLLLVLPLLASHLVKPTQATTTTPTQATTTTPTSTTTTSVKPADIQSSKQVKAAIVGKQPANERLNVNEADENGLYLVGLFDIHHSNPRVPFKCGQIDVDVGEWQSRRPMQNMEAFLWAIEQVNQDKSLLPGVRLGSLVMDTCSSFLRTNQQMANLLHNHQTAAGAKNGFQMPHARQIAAIVADNYDWQSVESTVSMASALDLTTFVTQSRSSKLSELARKYKPINQLELNQDLRVGLSPPAGELGPKFARNAARLDLAADQLLLQRRSSSPSGGHPLEGLLSELLGVGKMMTSPAPVDLRQQPVDNASAAEAESRLYMVRMSLGNEQLAETLTAVIQQMSWDLVSVIYDDELDMMDLHDELARQLLSRNTQLAHDELIVMGSPSESYDRLLQSLGRKSETLGARVVITLLGTGSARLLLDSLHQLRSEAALAGPGSDQYELAQQVNSLLWITVADREPYYAFVTDALGTIAVSSSVSLLPEFKSYYDTRLTMGAHSQSNRWWPEYMRAILLKHQRDLELLANECARWQEPKHSPALERCRSLSLSSLIQLAENTKQKRVPMVDGINNSSLASGGTGKLPPAINATTTSSATTGQQMNGAGSKLTKYLAGGWEHNGMDIINSVLAAANGLEAIRQTLCPGQRVGLCDRMRELISPPGATTTIKQQQQQQQQEDNRLPTVSQLMYNELLRSTFQLADGRMFNLDDFSSQGGQVEGKFKLYNLRYLQPTSIGFVKIGAYDQLDGLELNSTKARYYPAPSASYRDQEPIERVRSSCQDESKCLMFGTLLDSQHQQVQYQQQQQQQPAGTAGMANKQTISEEELAAGVNSLFKLELDHPKLISSSPATTQARPQQPLANNGKQLPEHQLQQHHSSSTGDPQASNQQTTTTTTTIARQVNEDSLQVHTMRSPSSMSRGNLNWSAASGAGSSKTLKTPTTSTATFNTIVLMQLHNKGYQSSRMLNSSACSRSLSEHSFQRLAALAYAQQLVVNSLRGDSASGNGGNNDDNNDNNTTPATAPARARHQIELTTTVIDYSPDQLEAAKYKLVNLLSSSNNNSIARNDFGQQNGLATTGKSVAVIDFESDELSESIESLVGGHNLLHLTIASGRAAAATSHRRAVVGAKPSSGADGGDKLIGRQDSAASGARPAKPLKVNLLPSKLEEIQALVKLVSSMGQWRLLTLIYTDRHHYRDEFVRRANEANICVSKLIWIPTVATSPPPQEIPASTGADEEEQPMGRGAGVDGLASSQSACKLSIEMEQQQQQQQMMQLEKTRKLFARELFDYSRPAEQQQQWSAASGANQQAQGLNSTRLLVVLASESDATNQMILEAATDSMLDDYIWLTTHEWLASVELPAAAAAIGAPGERSEPRLPRYFLSTRLETFESHEFKRYLASLTPALHSPLPTPWFDEFWQQHFHCRLPFGQKSGNKWTGAACKPGQALDLSRMAIDDRVHYTVQALESIGEALRQSVRDQANFSPKEFVANFKRSFARQSGAASGQPLAHLSYGFHVVHRLLPARSDAGGRRENSRDLGQSTSSGELMRVGLWRRGELVMPNRKLEDNNATHAWFWSGTTDSSDMDTTVKVVRSLNRLAAIKSRCSSSQTCSLCRQQIERTMALIEQEEAQLGLSESVWEPKAISSIGTLPARRQKSTNTSILDAVPNNVFDDDGDNDAESSEVDPASEYGDESQPGSAKAASVSASVVAGKADRRIIEASASSMFDPTTGRQLERQRESDMRRVAGYMSKVHGVAAVGIQPTLRQLPGLLVSLLSLFGVVICVASITYFYPNMLERKSKHHPHFDLNQSAGNQQRHLKRHSIQAKINDYFLLTGLLSLCSINLIFILPPTMSVCWFRRVGLATSYTVIFSSILVKVLSSLHRRPIKRLESVTANDGKQCNNRRPLGANEASPQRATLPDNGQQQQQQVVADPLEESVEVTFESLPHYHDASTLNVDDQHEHQPNATVASATIDHQLTSYANNTGAFHHNNNSQQQSRAGEIIDTDPSQLNPARLLAISICLIVIQLIISLVWSARQPDPTLFNCLRCPPPATRSRNLFLYPCLLEPLISLLYPALILVVSWTLAIVAFRDASQAEEIGRANTERSLLDPSSHLRPTSDRRLMAKQRLLNGNLKEAKALVIVLSLVVLVWSLLTLNMISSSQKLSSISGHHHHQQQPQQPAIYSLDQNDYSKQDDLTIVYANLFTGAITFIFLFIYRLHLISCAGCVSLLSRSKSKQLSLFPTTTTANNNGSLNGSLLKFNQHSSAINNNNPNARNKWLGELYSYMPTSSDTSLFGSDGSLFSAARVGANHQELRCFSTYGATHSSSVASSDRQADPMSAHHTVNPLHSVGSESFLITDAGECDRRSNGTAPGKSGAGSKNRLDFFESRNKLKGKKRQRTAPGLFSAKNKSQVPKSSHEQPYNGELQRRRSAGSIASSTTRLIEVGGAGNCGSDTSSVDNLDGISCASSIASSQVLGTELYPIDCSVQLDAQLPNPDGLNRSASRRSIRAVTKLRKVVEEEKLAPTTCEGNQLDSAVGLKESELERQVSDS